MVGLMRVSSIFPALVMALVLGSGKPVLAQTEKEKHLASVCNLIHEASDRHGFSPHFFARLIWKESLFDPNAVSPKGAEGIAQFMPGTAKMRGLEDPFDVRQALTASATYLAELRSKFGNLGLAAAAYNAGEARVSRWLSRGGFLPLETENYVLHILGRPADSFTDAKAEDEVPPLDPEKPFQEACILLPVAASTVAPMARIHTKPWGIQVAGHFRRDIAIRMWERARRQTRALQSFEPVVSQMRSGRGRRAIYAVRIGADTRQEAERTCGEIKRSGGSCIVLKN